MPQIASDDQQIKNCFDVMSELRPHLRKAEFLNVIRMMEIEGYRLAYIENNGSVVAVAGFRVGTNLHMGRHLYVDDLVTADSERSLGHGKVMLDWLRGVAEQEGCRFFHLDSGTHRHRAHKFYFERDFSIASYHFSQELARD